MTIEEAIKNRERCLQYLKGCGEMATRENVEAVRLSLAALRAQQEAEKNKPQTNADWIRSMSDEELAAHLEDWQDWGGGLSKEMWLEWLREPVARGHWVRVEEGYTCSACGCFLDGYYIGAEDLADYKRCPKCEAPMDNE